MKTMVKILNLIFVVVLILSLVQTVVFGVGHQLRIQLKSDEGLVTSGIRVEILPVDPEDISGNGGADEAMRLYQDALANGLTGETAVSDTRGEIVFRGLNGGTYLVFERGGQKITFSPYLVTMTETIMISIPKIEESGDRTMTVTKLWDDGNNADKIRPTAVEVKLLRDGRPYRSVSLSAGNGWTHTFRNLPETGPYTVKETAVRGYQATYEETAGSVQITNHHKSSKPEALEVIVTKVWDDNGNEAGKRPSSVTVQLVRSGATIRSEVLSENNQWTTSFSGLDKGTYSVWEIPVEGYRASYGGNAEDGFVITNTLEVGSSEEPGGDGTDDGTVDPTPGDDPQGGGPEIPQMGAILWPVYLLFGLGILMVSAGIVVLRCESGGVRKGSRNE